MLRMKFIFSDTPRGAQIRFQPGTSTRVFDNGSETQILLGIGSDTSVRSVRKFIRSGVRLALEHKQSAVSFTVRDLAITKAPLAEEELGRSIAENCILAAYEFTKYKTPPADGFPTLESVTLIGASPKIRAGVSVGTVVANTMNEVRDLSNTPGGDMTPAVLADAARRMCKGTKAKVTVLGPKEMQRLGMGMVLGVAKGAAAEPRFIIAEYWGTRKKEKPIVLIGKGVTFDSGGLDIKPREGMLGMHHDMAGGGAVLGALAIAARLAVKKNVIALVPAVENAVSGDAYRPGDILRAIDGTTVEVLDTDAEGRLILGDALAYAARYTPRLVIDVATLTGASIIALGKRASAVLTSDTHLQQRLCELGEKSGDLLWPLPLWSEYAADMKGTHADLSNIPSADSRSGGVITAAAFLAHFARKLDLWAHIDMAPRETSIPEDKLAKGATGEPTRLLFRVIEEY